MIDIPGPGRQLLQEFIKQHLELGKVTRESRRRNKKVSRGKLIVFEGADASGKNTQTKLLTGYFLKNQIPSAYISFPRYGRPWGKMIKRYLAGDFGDLVSVDPFLASCLYAGDRMAAKEEVENLIKDGKTIICDRYVGSNIGHMAAKFESRTEQLGYIEWLEEVEYKENGIPKEDLTIFLDVPPAVSQKLLGGSKKDIHESDLGYLTKVVEVYNYVTKIKKNWVRIDCMENGKLMKPVRIHNTVLEILSKRGLI